MNYNPRLRWNALRAKIIMTTNNERDMGIIGYVQGDKRAAAVAGMLSLTDPRGAYTVTATPVSPVDSFLLEQFELYTGTEEEDGKP